MTAVAIAVLVAVAAAYALAGAVLILAGRLRPDSRCDDLPRVSIVVAARDEEAHLHRCLHSLAQVDYPRDRLEIILVDHQSRDRTGALLAAFSAQHHHARLVRVRDGFTALCGKAAAAAAGIERSHGEIVLMTDADCAIPPTWVRTVVSHFVPEVGVVCGFTTVHGEAGRFAQAQALDWLFLLSVAAGAGELGKPLSWVGNNLAFRRSAYDQVGGYRGVGFSLTEDFALFRAISTLTSWKVRYVRDPAALVETQALPQWRQVLAQRLRWAIGGRSVARLGKVLLTLGAGVRFLLVPAATLAARQPLAALVPLSVLLTDFLLLHHTCRALNRRGALRAFLSFEALFTSYVLAGAAVLPFLRALEWKGTRYRLRPPASPPSSATLPARQGAAFAPVPWN
ncbi:MAG: glycosyltransferase [Candidatus Oleimicrobiaceae bacterium]